MINEPVELVARFDLLALGSVLSRMRISVFHHLIDLIFAKTGRRSNRDLLFTAGAHVFRRHVHDAVRVNVKRDLDLRHAARRRRNADQMELTKRAIVRCHRPLALYDMHLYRGLIVRSS